MLETKKTSGKSVKFDLPNYFSLKIVNFVAGLLFLTALVLFHQSDYLNHYNNDSDRFIVACSMRVQSKLTTLLFALEKEVSF